MDKNDHPLPVHTLLAQGRFKIENKLGSGAFGVVYKAVELPLKRNVAIKVLHAQVDTSAFRALETDIEALRDVGFHPHFPALIHIDSHEGRPYLVMEYIAGETLEQRVGRTGYCDVLQACEYVRQAAEGLSRAHRKGIIHRDLKPANIMLADETIKILDLGMARLLDKDCWDGFTVGNFENMSPEQMVGEKKVDQRSDLYGLGCVFYFLLAAKPPFKAPTRSELIEAHLNKEPEGIRKLRPDVPKDVAKIVHRLLRKEPDERFSSASELSEKLREVIQARQPSSSKAQRWRVAVAAAVLVILGGGVWGWRIANSRPTEASELIVKASVRPNETDPQTLPIADVKVTFEIDHYRIDRATNDLSFLGRLGNIPPRLDDRIVVKAEFDRPVYAYLVAINPDGSRQMLLPEPNSAARSTVKKFVCPEDSTRYLTLDRPGMQGFLLLAAEKPLPPLPSLSPGVSRDWQSTKADYAWSYDGFRLQPLLSARVGIAEHGPRAFGDLCEEAKKIPGVVALRAVAIPVTRASESN